MKCTRTASLSAHSDLSEVSGLLLPPVWQAMHMALLNFTRDKQSLRQVVDAGPRQAPQGRLPCGLKFLLDLNAEDPGIRAETPLVAHLLLLATGLEIPDRPEGLPRATGGGKGWLQMVMGMCGEDLPAGANHLRHFSAV